MFVTTLKSTPKEDISIQIQLDNHSDSYICDCGDASLYSIKEYQNAKVIFISHTHIDHFINLDQFIRHQLGTKKRVIICGPKGIQHHVHSKIMAYHWNLIEEGAILYEIREIIDEHHINTYEIAPRDWQLKAISTINSGIVYQEDRFKVTYTILDHKLSSIAYAFKEKDTVSIHLDRTPFKGGSWIKALKTAFLENNRDLSIHIGTEVFLAHELFYLLEIKKGDSLGIIMDHAAIVANHQKILDTFSNFNHVLIECYYKNEDKESAITNFHSYAEQSGIIMNKAKVHKATPIHFSRKYRSEDIEEIIQEFETAFKSVL
ncbi:MBL fold metallo-hydrolase [Aquimarina rhabdastrellae]